jgi:hypothetical protein
MVFSQPPPEMNEQEESSFRVADRERTSMNNRAQRRHRREKERKQAVLKPQREVAEACDPSAALWAEGKTSEAVTRTPDDALLKLLGHRLLELQRCDEAAAAYERIETRDHKDHHNLGMVLMRLGWSDTVAPLRAAAAMGGCPICFSMLASALEKVDNIQITADRSTTLKGEGSTCPTKNTPIASAKARIL